jgi:hypothetical protein
MTETQTDTVLHTDQNDGHKTGECNHNDRHKAPDQGKQRARRKGIESVRLCR